MIYLISEIKPPTRDRIMRNTYELGKEFKGKTGMDVFNPPVTKVIQERSTAYIDWVESELLQAREELSQAKPPTETKEIPFVCPMCKHNQLKHLCTECEILTDKEG